MTINFSVGSVLCHLWFRRHRDVWVRAVVALTTYASIIYVSLCILNRALRQSGIAFGYVLVLRIALSLIFTCHSLLAQNVVTLG